MYANTQTVRVRVCRKAWRETGLHVPLAWGPSLPTVYAILVVSESTNPIVALRKHERLLLGHVLAQPGFLKSLLRRCSANAAEEAGLRELDRAQRELGAQDVQEAHGHLDCGAVARGTGAVFDDDLLELGVLEVGEALPPPVEARPD